MRPFLLLGTRVEDSIADREYAGFLRLSGLAEADLTRVRVEKAPLGPVDLDEWSGVILGGSPFNASTPREEKSDLQRRVEADLAALLDEVVARDFPFLGACYGIGTLGTHQGGVVDPTYAEPVGPVRVELTAAGRRDPLCAGLPAAFDAFVGHKEAIAVMPPSAVLLATSGSCPVQMFRIGENMYATQFHPELDGQGLEERIEHYKYDGYFEPAEADNLKVMARTSPVPHARRVLRNFVRRYRR